MGSVVGHTKSHGRDASEALSPTKLHGRDDASVPRCTKLHGRDSWEAQTRTKRHGRDNSRVPDRTKLHGRDGSIVTSPTILSAIAPSFCHSMKSSSKRKHNSVPSMTFCSTTQRSGPPVHDVLTRCGASNQCATETPSAVGLGIGFIGGGGQAISPMSVWGGRAAGYNQPRSNGNRSRKDTA